MFAAACGVTEERDGTNAMVRQVSFPWPPTEQQVAENPAAKLELREHEAREKLIRVEHAKVGVP